MEHYPASLALLIDALSKLPGIGPKSAQRLAFHILQAGEGEAGILANAIVEVPRRVRFCRVCFNIAEEERCPVCLDSRRDTAKICVVETARDIIPIEKSGSYRGLYHVLGGLISPMEGIGPKELHVEPLLHRLATGEVEEVIFAISSNVEGEAPTHYLADLIAPLVKTVSRIASGLPVGGELDFVDEITLARALQGRRNLT